MLVSVLVYAVGRLLCGGILRAVDISADVQSPFLQVISLELLRLP